MNEKKIIWLIAAVQFVNVLDFMMVMPMGPDFARALNIPLHSLGLIGGSYTLAASIAGLIGSTFLDRFDRRSVLFVCMIGLAAGTVGGGLATSLETLMLARIMAGIFGGPATSVALAIIADVVPPARRGRALGVAMGAFSVASVLGVPIGLEVARLGGWRLPFFGVGALCVVIAIAAFRMLPSLTGHLQAQADFKAATVASGMKAAPFLRREIWMTYLAMGLTMFGAFILIPHFSAYFQFNMGYPRESLGFLYMVGGMTTFVVVPIAGRMADRFGTFSVVCFGTFLLTLILGFGYMQEHPHLPALVLFVGFMVSMSIRNIASNSLSTRVPFSNERARYMSIQSSVTHMACALGAGLSSFILSENSATGALQGFPQAATLTLVLALPIPFILKAVELRVRVREAASAQGVV